MPIEFRCAQCGQLLRVPEDAAGKNARCPKCQALMNVPAAVGGGESTPPAAASAPPMPPAPAAHGNLPPGNPFAGDQPNFLPPPPRPPVDSPFGSGGPPPSMNPYASPAGTDAYLTQYAIPGSLPINPQRISADTVFNYAWEIWKANLGLLVGVTIAAAAINFAVVLPLQGIQAFLQGQGKQEAATGIALLGQVLGNLVQLYLTIGAVQINLKLARRQPAAFSDLFGGGGVFFPVIGGGILAALGLIPGFLCFIVPGVILILAFWPYYYLIVDRKAGVIESFSIAYRITNGNWASAFVLWLMSMGIVILGCLALCVGLLFAAPLVSMMFAVAYLMMAGQIVPYGGYPSYQPAYPPTSQT